MAGQVFIVLKRPLPTWVRTKLVSLCKKGAQSITPTASGWEWCVCVCVERGVGEEEWVCVCVLCIAVAKSKRRVHLIKNSFAKNAFWGWASNNKPLGRGGAEQGERDWGWALLTSSYSCVFSALYHWEFNFNYCCVVAQFSLDSYFCKLNFYWAYRLGIINFNWGHAHTAFRLWPCPVLARPEK